MDESNPLGSRHGAHRPTRGRVDSEYDRNLLHLGLAIGGRAARRDTPADRQAARLILAGLLLQSLPLSRALAIREGLTRAITDGTDDDRAGVQRLAGALSDWYGSVPAEIPEGGADADAILAVLEARLADIESFTGRFRGN